MLLLKKWCLCVCFLGVCVCVRVCVCVGFMPLHPDSPKFHNVPVILIFQDLQVQLLPLHNHMLYYIYHGCSQVFFVESTKSKQRKYQCFFSHQLSRKSQKKSFQFCFSMICKLFSADATGRIFSHSKPMNSFFLEAFSFESLTVLLLA